MTWSLPSCFTQAVPTLHHTPPLPMDHSSCRALLTCHLFQDIFPALSPPSKLQMCLLPPRAPGLLACFLSSRLLGSDGFTLGDSFLGTVSLPALPGQEPQPRQELCEDPFLWQREPREPGVWQRLHHAHGDTESINPRFRCNSRNLRANAALSGL